MRPVQEYRKESKGYSVIEIKYESATCFHCKNIKQTMQVRALATAVSCVGHGKKLLPPISPDETGDKLMYIHFQKKNIKAF